jgi:hypothetical protein
MTEYDYTREATTGSRWAAKWPGLFATDRADKFFAQQKRSKSAANA